MFFYDVKLNSSFFKYYSYNLYICFYIIYNFVIFNILARPIKDKENKTNIWLIELTL